MRERNLLRLFACVALVAVPSTVATMSSAQVPAPPAVAPAPPPLPQLPPSLVPAHVAHDQKCTGLPSLALGFTIAVCEWLQDPTETNDRRE